MTRPASRANPIERWSVRPPQAWLADRLARFLVRQTRNHGQAPASPTRVLLACLHPGDVLLIEGHSRISTAIKYLTQSTWSHAALYVGDALAGSAAEQGHCFVEADVVAGVRSIGIEEYAGYHTRICRPVGLTESDGARLLAFAIERIGSVYDLRNVIDLARYLLPTPPVPSRWRRRLLTLGSGDPTRMICSTLIAQAFQHIRYPILPIERWRPAPSPGCPECAELALETRHHSLFAPRDFDVSPYFEIVKPTLAAGGLDYRSLEWCTSEIAAERPSRRSNQAAADPAGSQRAFSKAASSGGSAR